MEAGSFACKRKLLPAIAARGNFAGLGQFDECDADWKSAIRTADLPVRTTIRVI
jgi:hypothetical protein